MSIDTVEALYMADSHARIDQQGARAKYSGAEAEVDSGRCEGVGGTNVPPPMAPRRPCRPPPPIRTKSEASDLRPDAEDLCERFLFHMYDT